MSTDDLKPESAVEKVWRTYLTTGEYEKERRQRRVCRLLPGSPRCKNCYAPFHGAGSYIARLAFGKMPSNLNPQLCNVCEIFARKHLGGAEVELSLLFGDVRGSTQLAENLGTAEFSRLINRFYRASSQVLVHSDALIDKIIGDQVAGMYVPGIAGATHARKAIEAAGAIMQATGHGDPDGPWVSLGAGVHTGTAYVGTVGSQDGTIDITVLGDAANTAARLASSAGTGEILISEPAYRAAGLDFGQPEIRKLELKGKSAPMSVYVLKIGESISG